MEILEVTTHKMDKALAVLHDDLKTIRTGMANASLLEHVHFDYYGSPTPINQVASVKVVEGRQLVIKPYDKGTLKDIERAISMSDTGLVPQSDGEVIRLNVPSLTEDRRKMLSKEAHKMGEEAKIAIRNVRREANEVVKKEKDMPEDEKKAMQEKIQKVTDTYGKDIDAAVAIKAKEIMGV